MHKSAFLLPRDRTGGRRGTVGWGGSQAMGAGPPSAWRRPGRRAKWRGGRGGPIPALTLCGDCLRRAVHGDGWWPAMVSGGSEQPREVEEGRCWGSLGRLRGGSGADL
jgi:hypothetical protein